MLYFVAAHFLAGILAPVLVPRLGRRAFLLLSLVPAATFAWAVGQSSAVLAGAAPALRIPWVPTLGLELSLRMTTLPWVMTLVVTGIGALVLAYCAGYFADDEPGLGPLAGLLVAFAGAMLGLVLADDLLLLYVFWELTTVFSYLLIGHNPVLRTSRNAALQALLVTTLGGLAMLVGIVVIGTTAGSYSVSALLAAPPAGTAVTVGVLLMLVGAATKSALVPFHFWLPGAMAAPTPVSAYLHAAAMVKAGVYLVALLAPAFALVAGWHAIVLIGGVVTLLLGGWQALRQEDLKLLLAYGTVSQLGLLVMLLGMGTRSAALAGLAMLVAHALFKSALFLTVGVIDHQTGTRELSRLSGLGRRMPFLAAGATLAGASMAALPPLAGYVAKESGLAALLDVAGTGDGTGLGPWAGWLVVVGMVLGSTLTVAYTARFLWGAFATKPGVTTEGQAPSTAFAAIPVALGVLSLIVGFLGAAETTLLDPYADQFPAGAHDPELTLWHGPTLALWLTVAATVLGILLFLAREPVARAQARVRGPISAERTYGWALRGLDRTSIEVTSSTQRGSTSFYLSVVLTCLVLMLGWALAGYSRAGGTTQLILWDTPAQVVVGALVVAAAVLTARSRRRMRAVVLAGATGYGTSMLFLLHGAPDLALTQILVETVSIVVFVLVMRRLPTYFTDRPLTRGRYWRMFIGAMTAAVVVGVMLVATHARIADPVSVAYPAEAVGFGGGRNIVNVTLVDIRAWDTMGEIAVLIAAATGVASLVFLDPREIGLRRVQDFLGRPADADQPKPPVGLPRWLRAERTMAPERRSVIFEVVTRLIFHTIIVFSIWLLITGHNNPGGGFSAGLVTGLALTVRYLAGGRYELDEAAPIQAGALLGSGLFVATLSGLAPLAFGGAVLQSAVIDLHLPWGDLHMATSVFFDIGVYLVVVGLMLGLLRSLGSGIDDQIAAELAAQDDAHPADAGGVGVTR